MLPSSSSSRDVVMTEMIIRNERAESEASSSSTSPANQAPPAAKRARATPCSAHVQSPVAQTQVEQVQQQDDRADTLASSAMDQAEVQVREALMQVEMAAGDVQVSLACADIAFAMAWQPSLHEAEQVIRRMLNEAKDMHKEHENMQALVRGHAGKGYGVGGDGVHA